MNYRVILYHKHPTSARTRFLKYSYNSVLAFEPLAKLAQLTDQAPNTTTHPAMALKQVASHLGVEADVLKADTGFQHYVDVPGEPVQIILAQMKCMDPPFELAEKIDAQFIDLMQARGLPQVELELLRSAYEWVLGG